MSPSPSASFWLRVRVRVRVPPKKIYESEFESKFFDARVRVVSKSSKIGLTPDSSATRVRVRTRVLTTLMKSKSLEKAFWQ